ARHLAGVQALRGDQTMQFFHTAESERVPAPDQAPVAGAARGRRRLRRRGWLGTLLANRKAAVGVAILAGLVLVGVVSPLLWPGDPLRANYLEPSQAPSATHLFGTDQQGRDIFRWIAVGTIPTLVFCFAIAFLTTALNVIGVVGGYAGGWVDETLNLVTNIFLVLPTFPLIIAITSFVTVKSDIPIIVIAGLTSWAGGARVL